MASAASLPKLEAPLIPESSPQASSARSSQVLLNLEGTLSLPEAPELFRVVAIYDYRDDDDERNFQFNVGDEISVRERQTECWFGINLRTGSMGLFPQSHVKLLDKGFGVSLANTQENPYDNQAEETILRSGKWINVVRLGLWVSRKFRKRSEPCEKEGEKMTASEIKGIDSLALKERFQRKFGKDAEPKAVFKVLKCLEAQWDKDWEDSWMCFYLAYPQATIAAVGLRDQLQIISRGMHDWYEVKLHDCSAEEWVWKFSEYWKYRPNQDGQWSEWCSTRHQVRSAVFESARNWAAFKSDLLSIKEPIPAFNGMIKLLDGLIALLHSELSCIEQNMQKDLQKKAECNCSCNLKNTCGGYADKFPAVRKLERERPHRLQCLHSGSNSTTRLKIHHHIPRHHLTQAKIRRKWKQSSNGITTAWNKVKRTMGQTPAVLTIVLILTVASAATTGVATWECLPPNSTPIIDSNFWSTLSSAAIGTASLYCTIIPLLLEQKIDVWNPRLFRPLLFASLLTALAAVVVYPFQTRTSLVLLFIAGATQLATTLQIILGAVSKIKYQSDEIEGLKRRVRRR